MYGQITPPLINDFEFQDGVQTIARFATATRQAPEQIRAAILKEAEKDDVPIDAKDNQSPSSKRQCKDQSGLFGHSGPDRLSMDFEFPPECQQRFIDLARTKSIGGTSHDRPWPDRSANRPPAGVRALQ